MNMQRWDMYIFGMLIQLSLNAAIQMPPTKMTPLDEQLLEAVMKNDSKKFVELLDRGANLNAVDAINCTTTFEWLCESCNTDFIEKAFPYKPNVNLVTSFRKCPLLHAVTAHKMNPNISRKKQQKTVDLLLQYGSEMNQKIGIHETPLMYDDQQLCKNYYIRTKFLPHFTKQASSPFKAFLFATKDNSALALDIKKTLWTILKKPTQQEQDTWWNNNKKTLP